jgi:ABC-type polysaccharide/polyol phosphate export permease
MLQTRAFSLDALTSPRSWWLFVRFAQREVTNRFAGSLLGGLWAFVHPLALLLIFTFVFTAVFKVRAVGDGTTPFVVFLALALWPWMAFSEGVSRASASVVANGALVKKIPFAHELVVYAAVAASFAVQLLGYLLVLAYLAIFGDVPLHTAGLPLAAFSLLALATLATGLGLLLGAVHVFVRDLEQGLSHALALLFYLSPILYSASMLPEGLRPLMLLNPVAVLLEAAREGLLQGRALPAMAEWAAALFCLAVFVLGRLVFRRLSPHFEEAL